MSTDPVLTHRVDYWTWVELHAVPYIRDSLIRLTCAHTAHAHRMRACAPPNGGVRTHARALSTACAPPAREVHRFGSYLMTAVIPRESAVHRIAAHITDRDVWLITVPPSLLPTVAEALGDVPGWLGYVDNGTGLILTTDRPMAIIATAVFIASTAVVAVPKTVPAAVLAEALGRDVPADGSQDLILLHEGGPIVWPMLFVEALDRVEPAVAAHLRANDLANLS